MTASEKFKLVKRACDELKVCEVRYKDEPIPRYIHPLGICLTFNRGLVIVCCSDESYSPKKKEKTPLTNLPIEDCDHIKILEKGFSVWPNFVAETKICDDWLFHI